MASNSHELSAYVWPVSRLGDLIENLARRSKLISHPEKLPRPPQSILEADDRAIGRWIDSGAGHLGLEAEPVDTYYADFEALVHAGGPAILRLPGSLAGDQPLLLGLLRAGKKKVTLLAPDLRTRRVAINAIYQAMFLPAEEQVSQEIERLLQDAGVAENRLKRARRVILKEQLGSVRVECGWLLRYPPGFKLWSQIRQAGALRPALVVLVMYFFQVLLSIATWYVIGRGVFQGHFDMGWLMAWGILLFATIPVQLIVNDAQSELSMRSGAIFKQRLLYGTLRLEPEEIRHQGMGQFLGRVMESEAVEMLGLSGGFLALLSFIELIWAVFILANGAGGVAQAGLLIVWILIVLVMLWRYYQTSKEWTRAYQGMTNDLVERMVGHRTRLAQESLSTWHDSEDQAMDSYLKLSENLDRVAIQLSVFATRGWILVGLVGLALPFISNSASPQALAIGLAGVLLASQGFSKLVGGAQSLIGLFIAWRQVGPLFNAASRKTELMPLDITLPGESTSPPQEGFEPRPSEITDGGPLLVARDLTFRYRTFGRPVIQDCSLQIYPGDRLLLEGPSGGGKSTLAALLTGLRQPESGSLFLWGFDRQLLGSEEWRRHVVMAPQFQENHIFSDTLGFNLLMGRRWPPLPEDLQEAEAVCRALGLGDLLDRMPSGFQQMLGESGWQLSHGERSRLYIARTLLQKADLIILDESFGALDPENLYRSLRTVLERASTVMVIAHP